MYKTQKKGKRLRGDRLQPVKRLAIGNGQTTVGDRLQPSLTAPSMFNAVGQREGRAWAATLVEEVISGVDRLVGDHSDLRSVTGDKGLSH